MKSLSPTVAPRCQHTVAIALLLRTPAVVVVGGLVGDLFVPHVSNPSSDEPIENRRQKCLIVQSLHIDA